MGPLAHARGAFCVEQNWKVATTSRERFYLLWDSVFHSAVVERMNRMLKCWVLWVLVTRFLPEAHIYLPSPAFLADNAIFNRLWQSACDALRL